VTTGLKKLAGPIVEIYKNRCKRSKSMQAVLLDEETNEEGETLL
jgi:hypothetical protein